jgi:hypothetical protein
MTKEHFVRGYLLCFSTLWILYSLLMWVRPDILAAEGGSWSKSLGARLEELRLGRNPTPMVSNEN